MKNYSLELVVFICGAVVMILELDGSRILAPFIGNSLSVWTSLIGIILGSLSLGYFWGGKLADRYGSYKNLSLIILFASVLMWLITFIKDPLLSFTQGFFDLRVNSIISTLILFTPVNILLGMVTPYSVKLRINNLNQTGEISGNLYAISTIGSIVGTFLAGFYLISFFGSTQILIILSLILLLSSLITALPDLQKLKMLFLIVLGLSSVYLQFTNKTLAANGQVELDTNYYHLIIKDTTDSVSKKPIRIITTSATEVQSAAFLDNSNELAIPYTKYFRLGEYFKPAASKTLFIGGGAYSFPKDFLARNKEFQMDVVEIDPAFTQIAKSYFNLKDNPHLVSYNQDGRTFINKAQPSQYDIVYLDAFNSSYSIPFYLMTKEALEEVKILLKQNGVVVSNIISSLKGDKALIFEVEYNTYKAVFAKVLVFKVQTGMKETDPQNIILVGFKSKNSSNQITPTAEIKNYLSNLWAGDASLAVPILTDDFAPTDYYLSKLL